MRKYIPVFSADYGVEERTAIMQHFAVSDLITSGKKVDEFERTFAKHIGRLTATMTNSGSSALLAATIAMDWKPGDKIITPAVTFPTAISPLLWLGLVPVLVDIDDTLNIDPAKMEQCIKMVGGVQGAVIPHTLGNPVDSIVWSHFYKSIEDCCDALGSEIDRTLCGKFGTISCFSFYPAHHITTGEGGMATSMSHLVGDRIRQIVNWGRSCWCRPGDDDTCGKRFESMVDGIPWDHKYEFVTAGSNFKPSFDAQGVLGLIQLRKEGLYAERRRKNYNTIHAALQPLEDVVGTAAKLRDSDPVWFGYPLHLKRHDRREFIRKIEAAGVASRLVFGGNMARQSFLKNRAISPLPLEKADEVMKDWCVIGCNHTITEEEANYIATTVKDALTT